MLGLYRTIISIIGVVDDRGESPKFHKRAECDNCHKQTVELFNFNNLKLCKECFETQRKRFPMVKV